jgi:hypothetical protein
MTAGQKAAETRRLRREQALKLDAIREANRARVATGRCPECGGGMHRNLSLSGWWQCDRFGAPGFRRDPSGPACDWQCFTD